MKNTRIITLLLSTLLFTNSLNSQNIKKINLPGSWLGKITAGEVDLRVIFNFSIVGNDSLVVTLDSPDQGARNIKLGKVTKSGDSIKIVAPALLARYKGIIMNDTIIEGIWKQGVNTVVLNLTKLRIPFTINRPQEPKPPFPYTYEDVTFTNDKFNIKLAGNLTLPAGKGPFRAVIMITGSGAQNRNEELMGHKPFLVIADYLSRNHIAVLRYDDRGVGGSEGNYAESTSADLATDAEAAFNFLKNNPQIDPEKIGFIGHSEGGLIAPMVASTNHDIGFIVSLAGPGVTGEKLIIRQSGDIRRASGEKESTIKESAETSEKAFAILKKEKDNKKAEAQILDLFRKIEEKKKMSKEDTEKSVNEIKLSFGANSYTWFRYFIMTDPSVYWKKVKCPVLALNGEKDLQVAADINLPAIEKALQKSDNRSVKIVKLPGLNHLFQHCKTGLPGEYSTIDETFSPEALKIIAEWILTL
jgi:uncharacterized protein